MTIDSTDSNNIITEQEFLEACAYRSYVHSYYGLKPFYPH